MDVLYDNLEDYNEVNIVQELKCENNELKLKLEEYSKTMIQLQKDFDKISSEYKKLEYNYSSLLKTARAEIQRKTEMINTLNMEKDKLILKTLSNNGKCFANTANSQISSKGQMENNNSNNSKIENNEKQNNEVPLETKNQKDNRVDLRQIPLVDSVSNISTENKSSINEERPSKHLDHNDKNKNKENLTRGHKGSIVQSSKNTTSTKLPTPVNRCTSVNSYGEARFSSDESEFRNSEDNRKSPLMDELQYYEGQDNRDYMREPYEYHESSKEYSKGRVSRYSHKEKYKNVDNFVSNSRHRRHYSPERFSQRHSKDYTEYPEHYPQRDGHGRKRFMRNHQSDKYNRSRSRDKRFDHDKDNYHDYDKYSTRFYEHTSGKHKIRNELDEPTSKRSKSDIYNSVLEEQSCYINEREREFVEEQRTHIMKTQERGYEEHDYEEHGYEEHSCRSPDYIVIDSTYSEHPIKEIRATAATKLEDPRISSKNYILSLPNNTLSTVVGRNVDMAMVNKSVWGIKKIDVPALTEKIPAQESNNILKDIYMNIEDPALHDSLESGEIQSYDGDNDYATFYSRDIDTDHKNDKNSKQINIRPETQKQTHIKEKELDKKESTKSQSHKFRIPKIKKPDLDLPKIQDTCELPQNNLPVLEKSNVDVKKCEPSEHDNKHRSDKLSLKKEISKNIKNSEQTDLDKRKELIKTIEGDFELSDEASDEEIDKDTNQTSSKTESNIVQSFKECDTIAPSSKENNSATTTPITEKINTTKSPTNKELVKDSSKDSSKKRKRKRISSEKTEMKESHDTKKLKGRESKQKEKSCKEKKEKESISKETLNKFSDLFGDSNSLITPDDLGINNVSVQTAEKYSSIFDNTQDAVDLSCEPIISDLTSTSKSTSDTSSTTDSAPETVLEKERVEKMLSAEKADKNHRVNEADVNDNHKGHTNAEDRNVISSNAYENAKSDISKDEINIVKTVIISTGVQPESVTESASKEILNTKELVPASSDSVVSKEYSLNRCFDEALATSTQKCADTVAPTTKADASLKLSNSSKLNDTAEHETEADIPDVRIFVKRRRKPVKRST